jgi:hypothetical protein
MMARLLAEIRTSHANLKELKEEMMVRLATTIDAHQEKIDVKLVAHHERRRPGWNPR